MKRYWVVDPTNKHRDGEVVLADLDTDSKSPTVTVYSMDLTKPGASWDMPRSKLARWHPRDPNHQHCYCGRDQRQRTSNLKESAVNKPHKHAEVIKAWADGAQIQYRFSPHHPWEDVDDPIWIPDDEYRVKPANVVRFAGVGHTSYVKGDIGFTSLLKSKECATKAGQGLELKGVLRIELNPDTLEVVTALVERR